MIQIQSKVIDRFVNRLSMKQMIILTNRYDVKLSYKNPQKRKRSLQSGLRCFYKKGFVEECAICLDKISFETVLITPCAHMFCDTCIIANLSKSTYCPMCRSVLPYEYMFGQINNKRINEVYSSTNIGKLDIEENVEMNDEEFHQLIRRQHYMACINMSIWIIRLFVFLLICHIWITRIQEEIIYRGFIYDESFE